MSRTNWKRARGASNRRARNAGVPYELNIDLRSVLVRSNGICYLCNLPMRRTERNLDHVVPLSRGGQGKPHNLAYTHTKCNEEKSNQYPTDEQWDRHEANVRRSWKGFIYG